MKISALSRKKELHIVGIMNGTSLDGIDYVYCKIKSGPRPRMKFIAQENFSFPVEMKSKLIKAANHKLNVADLSELHHDLGRLYRDQFGKIIARKKWKIDVVGLHGQTVYHAPPGATLQIGEPSYLSAEFEIPVISDFRTADFAVGGEGSPIASLFHRIVFQAQLPKKVLSVHNLGGMSNLSLVNRNGDVERAFDTGPANMLMDLFISKVSHGKLTFDKNGEFACRGRPDQKLLDQILRENSYFRKKPPKSCGREQFGEPYLKMLVQRMAGLSSEDKMATLTELTARSISEAYLKYCPKQPKTIILCGGGALNSYLRGRIQHHLPKVDVRTTEDFGWPVSSVEGAAFALLAAFRVWDKPSNLPKTTGAQKAVCLGKVTEAF